jgi:hypothetical protein
MNVGRRVALTQYGEEKIVEVNGLKRIPFMLPRRGSVGLVTKLPFAKDGLYEVCFYIPRYHVIPIPKEQWWSSTGMFILCSEEMLEPLPRITFRMLVPNGFEGYASTCEALAQIAPAGIDHQAVMACATEHRVWRALSGMNDWPYVRAAYN